MIHEVPIISPCPGKCINICEPTKALKGKKTFINIHCHTVDYVIPLLIACSFERRIKSLFYSFFHPFWGCERPSLTIIWLYFSLFKNMIQKWASISYTEKEQTDCADRCGYVYSVPWNNVKRRKENQRNEGLQLNQSQLKPTATQTYRRISLCQIQRKEWYLVYFNKHLCISDGNVTHISKSEYIL